MELAEVVTFELDKLEMGIASILLRSSPNASNLQIERERSQNRRPPVNALFAPRDRSPQVEVVEVASERRSEFLYGRIRRLISLNRKHNVSAYGTCRSQRPMSSM